MNNLPQIPENSPFNAAQRLWLNGYLAAIFNELATDPIPSTPSKKKERVPIIYASQSGNSEELAEGFGESLTAAGFDAPVIGAEDFETLDLTKEKTILVISSTWGEGDPPDNAVDFWAHLSSEDHPALENLRFGVLGLGDTNYLDFCAMAKMFDARFEALGATRLVPRSDCDTDFEETASLWFETVLAELGTEAVADETITAADKPSFSKKNPFRAKLIGNKKLNAEGSERDTRHFEFSLAGSGLSYEVGDVLGVFPKNDPELVDELIAQLGFDPEFQTTGGSLRTVLIDQFDVRTITAKFLEEWSKFSDSEELKSLLRSDPVDSSIEPYLIGKEVIDVAIDFPAKFSSPDDFIALLRRLGARLYSISSSPNAHPDEVHLTVATVTYETHGRPRKGVCSTYLADRVNGDGTVGVFLQTAKHFKLPEDLSKPVIMVGPGTGIAPFRAFLEERATAKGAGENWLFFGNPHEATDWLYREDFKKMQSNGALTKLSTAWSRDQETKVYVQDRIVEEGAELWKWLEKGAHFYVCGDAKRMAKDVDQALHQSISEYGKMTLEEAADYVSDMKKSKRYQRDVY